MLSESKGGMYTTKKKTSEKLDRQNSSDNWQVAFDFANIKATEGPT